MVFCNYTFIPYRLCNYKKCYMVNIVKARGYCELK